MWRQKNKCRLSTLWLSTFWLSTFWWHPTRCHHSFENCLDTWCQNFMVWSSGGCLCPEMAWQCNFSSRFIHQQRKNSNLCVLCWLIHLSWFQGPKYIPPSFWPLVTNHDVKSKISKKWFLRSLLIYTTFSGCWKVEQNT